MRPMLTVAAAHGPTWWGIALLVAALTTLALMGLFLAGVARATRPRP